MGNDRQSKPPSPENVDGDGTEPHWLPVADPDLPIDRERSSPAWDHTHALPEQAFTPGPVRGSFFRLEFMRDRWVDALATAFERERERGAAFLWAPVLLAAGIALYFALPREPYWAAFPFFAFLAAIVVWRAPVGSKTALVSRILCLVAFGASVAQWHVSGTNTVMLSGLTTVTLKGVVEKAERRLDGSARYTINLTGVGAEWTTRDGHVKPDRVRLTARKGGPSIQAGETITGLARVGPPSGPAFPGAYDFSFQLWFDGIGGNGFLLGAPKRAVPAAKPGVSFTTTINGVRAAIAETIRTVLPGESGALATALIVGDRSGIPKETAEHLRRSGLAHILAISGLHMALVAATVLLTLRSLGAAIPKFALRYSVKKWASGGALVATAGYLMISGGSVSTQRAFIMIAIMLLAVMMDRRALTMRNVAIAAFLVLLLAPEALLSPGFQMSFAAVAALVATYEQVSRWRSDQRSKPGVAGQKQRFAASMLRNITGLALTTLIAGLATGLFAAYHFYRIAPLGLIANLLAMPIVSILVMPMALISMLAMPFALEAAPLSAMALGVEWVNGVAQGVSKAGLEGGTGVISKTVLLLGSMALLIACLSRTWLKVFAVPFLSIAFVVSAQRTVPDILVLENGNQIGVFADDGSTKLLKPNAEKFSTRIWRQAHRPNTLPPAPAKRGSSDFTCDTYGCSVRVRGLAVVHVLNTARLFEDCRVADVLVIPYAMPKACGGDQRPLVLDRTALARNGARALSVVVSGKNNVTAAKPTILSIPSIPHQRPWTAHRFRTAPNEASVFAEKPN
ncbi:MAG: ComEC/Rec2 family competence protein [Pseudomonadota bacterium]